MLSASDVVGRLADAGFTLFSGVPCSYLTPLINEVIDAPRTTYVNAVNEGDAVAVAAGAWLGGERGVVMFQNSGFGNAVNPLTSLADTFRIPMLVVATWRGEPGGVPDEPQHELMGAITPGLFELLRIPYDLVSPDDAEFARGLARAVRRMDETARPAGMLLRHGVVEGAQQPRTGPDLARDPRLAATPVGRARAERFDQDHALAAIQAAAGDAALIATTGFTGRALYALGDHANQLYMAGSMGCAIGVGLGLATVRPDQHVVVIDGDGAVLMRMGALAMVGHERPPNLTHIVLDNAAHDSTGTQATVSAAVDLATVAAACGYQDVQRIERLDQMEDALRRRTAAGGPSFLHVRTRPRHDRKLPRPAITPPDVARRLREWLGVPACIATP